MTRISALVLGQPFWGRRIARELAAADAEVTASFVPQQSYPRLLADPPRSPTVVLLRAGFRVGAATWRGRLFDAYWAVLRRRLPRAIRCHYWLGTDVMDTIAEARSGRLRRSVLDASRDDLHLADASWLASELEEVDLRAEVAHVPQPTPGPDVVAALPVEFAVLSYVPERRFEFFGGPTIVEVARRLPEVRFDIVGHAGDAAVAAPPNLRWLGWVSDMPNRYARASVVLRIPVHDGLGQTVVEGLLQGRHVVYTHELPFVRTVQSATPDAVAGVLGDLLGQHRAGSLVPNVEGRAYALEQFDEARLRADLLALLRARA